MVLRSGLPSMPMKHLLQSVKTGRIRVVDAPAPSTQPGSLVIQTRSSLISAGTERMMIDFGRAGWIDKARQQPDKVRQVIDKAKTDGISATYDAVRAKLDQPLTPGYSQVGSVLEVGRDCPGFSVGDRVISNGSHAEVVRISKNLCARVPDSVADEQAAFTVVGAIALQGIRLAAPTLGETFVVTGLGLVGLLTLQLLRAQGCRVIGLDFDASRLSLAERFGARVVDLSRGADPLAAANEWSSGRGVDGVLITAATQSNEPVHQAAQMCRPRARIVLVGVTGLELSRDDFYKKELTFQVSCSYGPGRHDPSYEDKGGDYPIGHVRWTEQRNFEAVLALMADGKLDVEPLVSHRFPFERAPEAYDLLVSEEPSLGIMLEYCEGVNEAAASTIALGDHVARELNPDEPVAAVIGAGNYASRFLLPALQKSGCRLKTIVSSGGSSAAEAARKFGAEQASTDFDAALRDADVNTVIIATRHNSHADLTCRALREGKHVFVEKPLAISHDELGEVQASYVDASSLLMVGFKRRFAPMTVRAKELLDQVVGPKSFVMTVNAGAIAADHWTRDPAVGGGRIIGEACHFVDLLRFLSAEAIAETRATAARNDTDNRTITLKFAGGSIGTIHYFTDGDASFPKERLDVFCAGRVLQLDNFRELKAWGWPGFRSLKSRAQDKGQAACVAAFLEAVAKGAPSPVPADELFEVTRATLEAAG